MNNNNKTSIFLVSACLVGLKTRYDGHSKPNGICMEKIAAGFWVPVCPEQLGGLPTPRVSADIVGGDGTDVLAGRAKVITKTGVDVTDNFILGARQVLGIAKMIHADAVYLKSRSPSCGLSPVVGVTAALLLQENFEVVEF